MSAKNGGFDATQPNGETAGFTLYSRFAINVGIVPVGIREVAKLGDRFAIYLPKNLNRLWNLLHERRSKIAVFIYLDGELDGFLEGLNVAAFESRVTKASTDRYLLWLPLSNRILWSEIWRRKIHVDVALDIDQPESNHTGSPPDSSPSSRTLKGAA